MTKTKVTWQSRPHHNDVSRKLATMIQDGKTDGLAISTVEADNSESIERTWRDLESAQEWIDFVTNYNPISAVIVND